MEMNWTTVLFVCQFCVCLIAAFKVYDLGHSRGYRQGWSEAMVEMFTDKKNEGKAEKLWREFIEKEKKDGR